MADQEIDPRIIICMPTAAGPPAVFSYVRKCDKCSQEVWLSQRYEAEEGDIFRCVPCAAPDVMAEDAVVQAAPWTSADFKARLEDMLKRMK